MIWQRMAKEHANKNQQKGRTRRHFFDYGAGEMNRTPDLRITNALLYQLSYTGFGGVVAAILLPATHWYVRK